MDERRSTTQQRVTEGLLTLNGVIFRYQVAVSPRRRRIGLAVTAPHEIAVFLPPGITIDVVSILQSRASWLVRQHQVRAAVWQRRPVLRVGGWAYVLGDRWRLVPEGERTDDRVEIVVPDGTEDVRHELIKWYQATAPSMFRTRLQLWAHSLNVTYRALVIANGVTRWGYCRPDGTVGLNWRLYQAPLWVIDYVIVHEVAHRRYPHHQASFWEFVTQQYPDAMSARQWLKQYGEDLLW